MEHLFVYSLDVTHITTWKGGAKFYRRPDRVWVAVLLLSLMLCYGCQSTTPSAGQVLTVHPNESLDSFGEAKRSLYQIFSTNPITFYCACPYEGRKIDSARCGFKSERFKRRAGRTEVEHVVPAHAFGQSFSAWRNGHTSCVNRKGRAFKGRRCAEKVSPVFRRMSADLYNLRPAVGAVNALRKHYRMSVLVGEPRAFGSCDIELDGRRFEPRDAIRGDIARIYFYMEAAYPGRGIIAKSQRKLFLAWHRQDPVDFNERELAKRIEKVQGNENPFVTSGALPTWATSP